MFQLLKLYIFEFQNAVNALFGPLPHIGSAVAYRFTTTVSVYLLLLLLSKSMSENVTPRSAVTSLSGSVET